MHVYRNTSEHRRTFPRLQWLDGSTLELDPGEECVLAHTVNVPHLQRVRDTSPPTIKPKH